MLEELSTCYEHDYACHANFDPVFRITKSVKMFSDIAGLFYTYAHMLLPRNLCVLLYVSGPGTMISIFFLRGVWNQQLDQLASCLLGRGFRPCMRTNLEYDPDPIGREDRCVFFNKWRALCLQVRLWSCEDHNLVTIRKLKGRARSVAWHPKGNVLAVGCLKGQIFILDTDIGRVVTSNDCKSEIKQLRCAHTSQAWAICMCLFVDGVVESNRSNLQYTGIVLSSGRAGTT